MMKKPETKRTEKIVSEIELPETVSTIFDGQHITIKGAKGEVKKPIKTHKIQIKVEGKKIIIGSFGKPTKKNKKLLGSLVAHIKNMIKGVQQNHVYVLRICSGHFPMTVSVSDNRLQVKNFLGEKVPRVLQLKTGAEVKIDGSLIYVTSPSKELAGQISADIEQLTRRPGFDTRIFQDGCYIISKDGKELK